MSNICVVSPYAPDQRDQIPAGVLDDLAGIAATALWASTAVFRWLRSEDERLVLKRAAKERRKALVTSALRRDTECGAVRAEPPRIVSLGLRLPEAESLLRSAEGLGYRPEPAASTVPGLRERPILLRNEAGGRLAIERGPDDRLILHGVREHAESLVRRHTVDRAIEHFARKGMQVRTTPLANGEIEILAREQESVAGGAVKTQVLADGGCVVDIEHISGPRCEQMSRELAEAVGGCVSRMERKEAYWQLPGEPARTRVVI